MRKITSHVGNDLNNVIAIHAIDKPGAGGACHIYELDLTAGICPRTRIKFQTGPIKEAGFNGLSNEALLAVVIDRLQGFQAGPFACQDNADALTYLEGGMGRLLKRTQTRTNQGVEGTLQAHEEQPAAQVDAAAAPAAAPAAEADPAPAPVVNGAEVAIP